MSPSQSSNASSARKPRRANGPRTYYTERENRYLRGIKRTKRKTRRGANSIDFDDPQIELRADSVDVDDPQAGIQCLTLQDLWPDYQRLLHGQETQQDILEIANSKIRHLEAEVQKLLVSHRFDSVEIESTNDELDSARASLLDAAEQIKSAQIERDSARASLLNATEQVKSAQIERDSAQVSLLNAKDQVKSARSERDSAQSELTEIRASLLEATEQIKSSLLEAMEQMESVQIERDSAQSQLREVRAKLKDAQADNCQICQIDRQFFEMQRDFSGDELSEPWEDMLDSCR